MSNPAKSASVEPVLTATGLAPSTNGVPVIYADGCKHMGYRNDVLLITLTVDIARPAGERIETIPAIVAHLRLPVDTAKLLAEHIEKTIASRHATLSEPLQKTLLS